MIDTVSEHPVSGMRKLLSNFYQTLIKLWTHFHSCKTLVGFEFNSRPILIEIVRIQNFKMSI